MQESDASLFNRWSASSQKAMKSSGRTDHVQDRNDRLCSADGAWTYRRIENGQSAYAVVLHCAEPSEVLDIPAAIDGLPVREVAAHAFARDAEVRAVRLPASLEKVGERAFCASSLEHVEVDPGNEALSSDGKALYDAAGAVLLALLVHVERYDVSERCCKVAPGAFKGARELTEVTLPEGLADIGAFAFFQTGIQHLDCPSTLESIGEKAFSGCRKLASVQFNEGLRSIGVQAFSGAGFDAVFLPASLEQLGQRAFERTGITFDDERSFTISAQNASLAYDTGVLYQRETEGLVALEQLSESEVCRLLPETVEVADCAFEGARQLREVTMPEGLQSIGRRAFRGCSALRAAVLPDSLVSLGDEAFSGTSLEQVHIGSSLQHMGACALETVKDEWGAGRSTGARSLVELSVASENERFSMHDGILVEHDDDGMRTRLLCNAPSAVHIPRGVTEIADMTFAYAHIVELHVPSTVQDVGQKAFLGIDGLEKLHIVFPHDVDGFGEVTLVCPGQARDAWDFSRAFCIDSDGLFFDFSAYDGMAVFEHDRRRVIEMSLCRLEAPVKLSKSARANYESTLARLTPQAFESVENDEYTRALARRIMSLKHVGVFEGCLDALAHAVDEAERVCASEANKN